MKNMKISGIKEERKMTILSAVLYYVVTIFESLCLGELLGTFLAFFGILMYNLVKKRENILSL